MTLVLLIMAGLALAAFAYVLLPLFQEKAWPFAEGHEAGELRRTRRQALWAIADVDDEYQMGKLSEQDHAALRAALKKEALPVLKRERHLMGEARRLDGKGLERGLKEDLLREVVRICGTRDS
ncbi:MAG: hypothetical protein P8Y66_08060 [Nitrospirota bacterium]|jgi:hypothetical protein